MNETPGDASSERTRWPPPVVTISASYGAGGSLVGPRVADELGVTFLDRAIPASVAADLAEPPDEVLAVEDDLGRGISRWVSFFTSTGVVWTGIPLQELGGHHDEPSYKEHIGLVLRREAERGAVILGRGAAIVLAEHPGALHVRLDGPVERRIAQVMDLGAWTSTAPGGPSIKPTPPGIATSTAFITPMSPTTADTTCGSTPPRSPWPAVSTSS